MDATSSSAAERVDAPGSPSNYHTAVPPTARASTTARAGHLRRRQDFVAVLQDGRRMRHRLLSLGLRPNGLDHNRLGYAVGRRVGPSVVRNRVRRRLREILRALPLTPGFDLVLTPGPQAVLATFDDLREAVRYCAARANLLLPPPTEAQQSPQTT